MIATMLTLDANISPEDVERIRRVVDDAVLGERERIIAIIEADDFEYDYDYNADDEPIPSIPFYAEALVEAIRR